VDSADDLADCGPGGPSFGLAVKLLVRELGKLRHRAFAQTGSFAELMAAVLAQGNGACFQRAAYRRSGRLSDVIRDAAVVTEAG
jgi:hypothetical protein